MSSHLDPPLTGECRVSHERIRDHQGVLPAHPPDGQDPAPLPRAGLLVPYAVDEASGYRRYSVDQVPDAPLIGRLRRLDMPLAQVRRVLDSTDRPSVTR